MRYIATSIAVIFISLTGLAQGTDSIKLISRFIEVSTGYKQLPLHLSLEFRRTSNIPANDQDSSGVLQGDFYLQARGAYIHFGDIEQVVTDTMVLIVMNREKQMVLSETGVNVAAQLQTMMGMRVTDTSLRKMADRYRASKRKIDDTKEMISLENRIPLYGTKTSSEVIEMTYDSKDRLPLRIVSTKRSLIQRSAVAADKSTALQRVLIQGKGEFLIKEESTIYEYKKIVHDMDMKLPVLLSDRVEKDQEMNFVPVKAFEGYSLIKN